MIEIDQFGNARLELTRSVQDKGASTVVTFLTHEGIKTYWTFTISARWQSSIDNFDFKINKAHYV